MNVMGNILALRLPDRSVWWGKLIRPLFLHVDDPFYRGEGLDLCRFRRTEQDANGGQLLFHFHPCRP